MVKLVSPTPRFSFLLLCCLCLSGLWAQTKCDSLSLRIAELFSKGEQHFNLIGVHIDEHLTQQRSLTEVYTESGGHADGSSLYKGKSTSPSVKRGVIARLTLETQSDSLGWRLNPLKTALPAITIDARTKTAQFNGQEMALKNCFRIKENDNILKSPWEGMLWKHNYRDSTGQKTYKLVLGRLDQSQRLYIEVKGQFTDYQGQLRPYTYRLVSTKE
ncbi:hypothetical protein [Sediminicola luteus]|uniref:Uncharacterized protein n=1 Tax=Sediminicola luteus TaxID=319238 RepID=A0A2A4GFJ2_9FLAO|nr:hypothetical protein [Sediminicola luteus]PCE66512.1 hypothetical protein B7P33_04240 [Sediminicola luteus]